LDWNCKRATDILYEKLSFGEKYSLFLVIYTQINAVFNAFMVVWTGTEVTYASGWWTQFSAYDYS